MAKRMWTEPAQAGDQDDGIPEDAPLWLNPEPTAAWASAVPLFLGKPLDPAQWPHTVERARLIIAGLLSSGRTITDEHGQSARHLINRRYGPAARIACTPSQRFTVAGERLIWVQAPRVATWLVANGCHFPCIDARFVEHGIEIRGFWGEEPPEEPIDEVTYAAGYACACGYWD